MVSVNLFDIEEDGQGKRESVTQLTDINAFCLVTQLGGELFGVEKNYLFI